MADAIQKLRDLGKHFDGCGKKADNTDWVLVCGQQVTIRDLIDLLISNLGG